MSWPPAATGRDKHGIPAVLTDFAAAGAVSTETPLLALTELGPRWGKVWFTVRNHDATNAAEAIVDRSESGSVNDELRQRKLVPPLGEVTFTYDDSPGRELARMFALAASGDPAAAFPLVLVSWQLRVQLRQH